MLVLTINTTKKHATLLCAFLFFACSPAQQNDEHQQDSHNGTLSATQVGQAQNVDTSGVANSNTSLLTLAELLAAQDVKQGLATAVQDNNRVSIEDWQTRLLQAAKEVNLSADEVALISGEQGKVYLQFQGMKTNYHRDFERAFFQFGDVDSVYEQYPAFIDMHEQSKALVTRRDNLIEKVAVQLKNDGFSGDAFVEARKRWQEAMNQSK